MLNICLDVGKGKYLEEAEYNWTIVKEEVSHLIFDKRENFFSNTLPSSKLLSTSFFSASNVLKQSS